MWSVAFKVFTQTYVFSFFTRNILSILVNVSVAIWICFSTTPSSHFRGDALETRTRKAFLFVCIASLYFRLHPAPWPHLMPLTTHTHFACRFSTFAKRHDSSNAVDVEQENVILLVGHCVEWPEPFEGFEYIILYTAIRDGAFALWVRICMDSGEVLCVFDYRL